jgi:hypothetical protein
MNGRWWIFSGHLCLEADGRSVVLGFVGLWGDVRQLLQTAWRTATVEDIGAAAYQVLLLACYAWKVLDDP